MQSGRQQASDTMLAGDNFVKISREFKNGESCAFCLIFFCLFCHFILYSIDIYSHIIFFIPYFILSCVLTVVLVIFQLLWDGYHRNCFLNYVSTLLNSVGKNCSLCKNLCSAFMIFIMSISLVKSLKPCFWKLFWGEEAVVGKTFIVLSVVRSVPLNSACSQTF